MVSTKSSFRCSTRANAHLGSLSPCHRSRRTFTFRWLHRSQARPRQVCVMILLVRHIRHNARAAVCRQIGRIRRTGELTQDGGRHGGRARIAVAAWRACRP